MDRLLDDDLLDEYRFPSKEVDRLLDRFLAVGEDPDNPPPLDEDIIPLPLEQFLQVVLVSG